MCHSFKLWVEGLCWWFEVWGWKLGVQDLGLIGVQGGGVGLGWRFKSEV